MDGSLMTEDEYYDYVKDSGQMINEQLKGYLPELQKMDDKTVKSFVMSIEENARQYQKALIFSKRKTE